MDTAPAISCPDLRDLIDAETDAETKASLQAEYDQRCGGAATQGGGGGNTNPPEPPRNPNR